MKLTEGAIQSLKTGSLELQSKPILQVLGYCKVENAPENDRYRLTLSDGVRSTSFAILAPHLNVKIVMGILNKLSVIRVEQHKPLVTDSDTNLMLLMDMSIILGGLSVGRVLGSPTAYSDELQARILLPPTLVAEQPTPDSVQATPDIPMANDELSVPIIPVLQTSSTATAIGSSNAIRLSEEVIEAWASGKQVADKPVLQTLRCQRLTDNEENAEEYSMILSDGKYFAVGMLGMSLKERARSGAFQNNDIVRVDSHVCCIVPRCKPLLVILEVSVLRCGSEVGGKFGNPLPVPEGSLGRVQPNRGANAAQYNHVSALTQGALGVILSGQKLNFRPVLQILGQERISVDGSERYRLYISDGKFAHQYALLSKQMNHRVVARELSDYTVFVLRNHMCTHVLRKCVLIITALEVLSPGTVVKRQLGNPVTFFCRSS